MYNRFGFCRRYVGTLHTALRDKGVQDLKTGNKDREVLKYEDCVLRNEAIR